VVQSENEGGDTEKEVSTRTPSENTEILPENVPMEEPAELNIEREDMQEESSTLRDDSSHPVLNDKIEVIEISDQSPPTEFQPCIIEEEIPPSEKGKKISSSKFISSLPKWRTRAFVVAQATKMQKVELVIPILHPRSLVVTQEPVGEQQQRKVATAPQEPVDNPNINVVDTQGPVVRWKRTNKTSKEASKKANEKENQLEELIYENELLKQEVSKLRADLEEMRKSKAGYCTLGTLANVASTFENMGDEIEEGPHEYMCPECANIFKGDGYKVILQEEQVLVNGKEQLVEIPLETTKEIQSIKNWKPKDTTVTQEPVVPIMENTQLFDGETQEPPSVDKEIQTETPTSIVDEAIQTEDLLEFVDQAVQTEDLLEVMDNDMKTNLNLILKMLFFC
jgi:hypothetical protein